jgi:ferredoxin-NADP reductase
VNSCSLDWSSVVQPSVHIAPGLPSNVQRVLASRLVTALAAPHGVDRYLELFHPLWSLAEVRAEVVAKIPETPDAVTLRLCPNRNWRGFEAGQYVRLTLELGGVRRTRCYSLSSSAHRTDGLVDLSVKRSSGGQVSASLIRTVRVGQVVVLSQAEGRFTLPMQRPPRILFVSGGSGITPCMAMLRTLRDEGYAGRITFLHYAPSHGAILFHAELVESAQAARGANRDREA